MKKVIFLLVFIVSFSHAGTSVWATAGTHPDYNSATDRLYVNNTRSYPDSYELKYATAYTGTFSYPTFCRCVANGWYPSSDNSYYKCDTVEYLGFDDNYQCPSGQTIVNGSCECPPRPTGYNIDVPLTEENCNITQASLLLSGSDGNGQTRYITAVQWESCRGVCMGTTAECPCNTALLNGACVDVSLPDGQCSDGSIFKNTSIGVATGEGCRKTYYSLSSGFECWSAPAGCCTGNTGTNDGDGDGQPDTNTTNPDTNTTNPGDLGEDGGETGGETGGGDSNTSTPAPGDSNTSTPAPGDSNTSTPYEDYEESDADKDGKESISGYLDEAVNTANKIKSDYKRLMSAIQNGVAPVSISSGSAPQFCATVFGKQICINLCDSFGYFYSIFYYIFLILLTVMALRIYYTAFKMR